ncbi:TolC family protein, partial [Dysgonomonas sp. Shenzhen-Wh21]
LDDMLGIYTKNFLNRNISMLEYLDFMESYKSNKQIVLLSRKNMYNSFVEFQYAVGTEINK